MSRFFGFQILISSLLSRVGYQIINELKILLPIPIKMTIQSWFEIPCMHSWFEKDLDCKISEDFNSFIKSFPKSIFICKVAWTPQLKLQNFQKRWQICFFSQVSKWSERIWKWFDGNQIKSLIVSGKSQSILLWLGISLFQIPILVWLGMEDCEIGFDTQLWKKSDGRFWSINLSKQKVTSLTDGP